MAKLNPNTPEYKVTVNDKLVSQHGTIRAAVLTALNLYDNATQIKVEIVGYGKTGNRFYQLFYKSEN